jgi:hypothetical protein
MAGAARSRTKEVPRRAVGRALVLITAAGMTVVSSSTWGGLESAVHATWSGLPLAAWTSRATDLAGVPVILDRRLDPTVPVSLECRGESVGEVITRVAATAGGVAERLAATIRIVPAERKGVASAGERARSRELAALPTTLRRRLLARARWAWADGARPRDLVMDAAASGSIPLAGIEAVPHDHLPALSLPPMSLAERLDLVLAHYDLRVRWQAGPPVAVIVPLEQPNDRDHDSESPRPDGGIPPPAMGRHPPPNAPPGGRLYSLRLEAPLEEALAAIGPRLGFESIELDRDSLAARGIQPGEIARAEVRDATGAEVLDAIVRPLGLQWRDRDGRVTVFAP